MANTCKTCRFWSDRIAWCGLTPMPQWKPYALMNVVFSILCMSRKQAGVVNGLRTLLGQLMLSICPSALMRRGSENLKKRIKAIEGNIGNEEKSEIVICSAHLELHEYTETKSDAYLGELDQCRLTSAAVIEVYGGVGVETCGAFELTFKNEILIDIGSPGEG